MHAYTLVVMENSGVLAALVLVYVCLSRETRLRSVPRHAREIPHCDIYASVRKHITTSTLTRRRPKTTCPMQTPSTLHITCFDLGLFRIRPPLCSGRHPPSRVFPAASRLVAGFGLVRVFPPAPTHYVAIGGRGIPAGRMCCCAVCCLLSAGSGGFVATSSRTLILLRAMARVNRVHPRVSPNWAGGQSSAASLRSRRGFIRMREVLVVLQECLTLFTILGTS